MTTEKDSTTNLRRVFQITFAVPWLIFGLQHLMFADFVGKLVPSYFPNGKFWAYLTGAAMIAAGISFITNIKVRLAAILLGVMLFIFILLIHVPKLLAGNTAAIDWTRALQDLFICLSALLLAEIWARSKNGSGFPPPVIKFSQILMAILLVIFGVQQFLNLNFLTAKVPMFLPFRLFWIYLTGTAIMAAGICVIINKKVASAIFLLGIFLLIINLLNHGFTLINDWKTPLNWTAAMLDLAIVCGIFFLADALQKKRDSDSPINFVIEK
jgi:uncharacterized membrane protein YphA (DoxX/SURF4 family)